jgi:predicted phosphodiesterase
MAISERRRDEVRSYAKDNGYQAASEHFGLSRETVRRYCRKGKFTREETELDGDVAQNNTLLSKIQEKYSPAELRLLAHGGLPMEYKHAPVHKFDGDTVKIGYMSDMHIGSVYTNYDYITEAREEFAREGVDMVVMPGDITEGMSNRPGHIYECTELGYDRQKEKAIELLSEFDYCPVYMIDGNHDRWYIKSNGAIIVKDICNELPHAEFLGHDEGDIMLNDTVQLKLWHGEDASSYAFSYRLQKLVESLSGGEKPHILLGGHVHKYFCGFMRNVHCISTGCIQEQSKWMRGKRIPAHTGFGICEATVNETGVGKFGNTWYPFYA